MIRDPRTRMTDPEELDCNGDVTAYYSELDDVPWEAEKYQVGNTVFYGFFARIAKKMDENGEWEETYCSCGEVLTSDAESISGECENCMLSERPGEPESSIGRDGAAPRMARSKRLRTGRATRCSAML